MPPRVMRRAPASVLRVNGSLNTITEASIESSGQLVTRETLSDTSDLVMAV